MSNIMSHCHRVESNNVAGGEWVALPLPGSCSEAKRLENMEKLVKFIAEWADRTDDLADLYVGGVG